MTSSFRAAVLVIDVQSAMFSAEPLPHRPNEVLSTIGAIIEKARAAGVPVIYVQHENAKFEELTPGAPGWEIHDRIAPLPGDRIVRKTTSDSFYHTRLQDELSELGVRHLVVTGLATEKCVDTTCRRAKSLDYDVTLVSDGHTTWDTDTLTAQQIIAMTNANLSDLGHPVSEIAVLPSSAISF